MRTLRKRAILAGALAGMIGLLAYRAHAVEDGLGTNYVDTLSATAIELDGVVRTSWPVDTGSFGGGPLDFRAFSNEVVWTSAFRWDGHLQTARMQTDGGEADVLVVRAKWNDAWGSYTAINSLKATTAGVSDSTWSASWISNEYRVGIIVTNFTTGTNLWWSIDYTR